MGEWVMGGMGEWVMVLSRWFPFFYGSKSKNNAKRILAKVYPRINNPHKLFLERWEYQYLKIYLKQTEK